MMSCRLRCMAVGRVPVSLRQRHANLSPCQPRNSITRCCSTHKHTHHPDSSTLSLQAKTQQTFQTGRVIPPCVLLAMGWIGYEAFLRPHSVVTTSLLDFNWSEHFGLNSFLPLCTKKTKCLHGWSQTLHFQSDSCRTEFQEVQNYY